MFSPSSKIHDPLTTMTSADFSGFSRASLHGLFREKKIPLELVPEISPGKNALFHAM
jgi:hypothetical protein